MGSRKVCDVLISVSLVYCFNKWRSEISRYGSLAVSTSSSNSSYFSLRTENIIDGIIAYVVGVGVVTRYATRATRCTEC